MHCDRRGNGQKSPRTKASRPKTPDKNTHELRQTLCKDICMYACVYVCICKYTFVYACIYVCMHARMYVCMCILMNIMQCFPTFFQPRHTYLEPLTRRHTISVFRGFIESYPK